MHISKTLVIIMFAIAAATFAAQGKSDNKQSSSELVTFVRDARKIGISDADIKRTAVKEGWQPAEVDRIMAAAHVTPAEPAADNTPKSDRGVPENYQIGAGDVLNISVWKEPDATVPSVVVRPDGKIAMPLIKEMDVLGLTPTEVEKRITERLSKVIIAADVTVIVTQVNSKKIYVIGAVKTEGTIPIKYRMTVLQALTEAGGLTDYAKRKKIYILRAENGRQYRLPFNYEEVIRGERIEQNILMRADDTIVVPQ